MKGWADNPSALLNGGDYPWSGDPHEGVAPDQHGGEHRGVKPNGRRRMAMGEHELSSSFPHQPLATSEAFRSELDGSKMRNGSPDGKRLARRARS